MTEEYEELVDICCECRCYGDDDYINDDGETASRCEMCWVKERLNEF